MKSKKSPPFTVEYLKTRVVYDPETGFFYRRSSGKRIGHYRKDGYLRMCVSNFLCVGGSLAWFYMTGEWPLLFEVDHIDRDPSNNAWSNLRLATRGQNSANTRGRKKAASSYKGVYSSPHTKPWRSSIRHNGKTYFLGYFETEEEAFATYCRKAQELNREFACFG